MRSFESSRSIGHPFIESMDRQGILEVVFPEIAAMKGSSRAGTMPSTSGPTR